LVDLSFLFIKLRHSPELIIIISIWQMGKERQRGVACHCTSANWLPNQSLTLIFIAKPTPLTLRQTLALETNLADCLFFYVLLFKWLNETWRKFKL
jgi:hypothetical protein